MAGYGLTTIMRGTIMNRENMRTLMESALVQMEQDGASAKMLKSYRATGFGAIVRHCEKICCPNYTKALIDDFINQTRAEYERSEISSWKWQQIRRGCELLKHFQETKTLDLPPCIKWEALHNPLHCKPTPEELIDSGNIFTLVWRVKNELMKFGLTQKSLNNYQYDGFDRILRSHIDNNQTIYSQKLTEQLVADARNDYEFGKMCHSVCRNIRKIAALLEEYYNTGKLEWHYLSRWGLREPCDYFAKVLEAFCSENKITGDLEDSTIATARSAIRGFLFGLEDMGYKDFTKVTLSSVSYCISHMAKRYAGGTGSMLFSVRAFLLFLSKRGISTTDLSIAIPELSAPKRVVREGFHTNEIDKLLSHSNKNTSVGKRDHAIMITAAQTGLRAIDIVNLERKNIDWRTNEIRIVQHKTGVPLSLPLTSEVGNAIVDYLRNGRPACDLPCIFLCKDKPYRPLKNRSASAIVSRYMRYTKIADSTIPRRGFHSFRRSFGGQLLNAEISIDMLIELLGQTHIDSAKPYLAVNEMGLKNCALSLAGIKKAGEMV
jgi:site-specific recombinase XerD